MLFHTCLSRVACKSITRAAESWSVGSRLPLSVYFQSLLTSPYLVFVLTAVVVAAAVVVVVAVVVAAGLLPAQSHSARSQHYIQNASLALPVLHRRAIPNNYVSMQLRD